MKKLNLFTELCGIILGAGIYGLAVTGINIPSITCLWASSVLRLQIMTL